jgi:putative nucleotidyltransferase with HDIG domain
MPEHAPRAVVTAESSVDWMKVRSTNIPMLPELATRVISLVSDPNVTLTHLAQVITKDQVLTTRLLSLANSAYYASAADISSVPEAIMRVGSLAVRNQAVTLCVTSRMTDRRVYGEQGQDLVHHGIGTAYVARLVADETSQPPDQAFLCGLLHDIGKLVMLKWRYDHVKRTGEMIDPSLFEQMLATRHAEVGSLALQRWGLPADLEEPVLCHHDYAAATGNRELAAVIYLANRLSHRYGFGCQPDDYDPMTDPVTEELGLDANWIAELDAKAPGLYEVARQGIE